jgi:hypothetical protein
MMIRVGVGSYNHCETIATHNFQQKDGNNSGFQSRKRSPFENRINMDILDRKEVAFLPDLLDLDV